MASPTSEQNSREIQELQDNVNNLANITDSIATIDRRQDDYIANMISDFNKQNAAMDSMSAASKSEVKSLKQQINNLKAKIQQLKDSSSTQELDVIKAELKKVKKEVGLYKKAAGLNTGGQGGGTSAIDLAKVIDSINGNTTATRSVATSLQHNTQAIKDNTVAVKDLAQSISTLPTNNEAKPQTAPQTAPNGEYERLSKEKQSLRNEESKLLRRQSELIGELSNYLKKEQKGPSDEQLSKIAADVATIKDNQQKVVEAIKEQGSKIQNGIETLGGIASSIGKSQPPKETARGGESNEVIGTGDTEAADSGNGTIIDHLAAIGGGVDHAAKSIDEILRSISGQLAAPEDENGESEDNSLGGILNRISGGVDATSKGVSEMIRVLGGQAEAPEAERNDRDNTDNILSHLAAINGGVGTMSSDVSAILAAIASQGEKEDDDEGEEKDDTGTVIDHLSGIDEGVDHIAQSLDNFMQALSEKLALPQAEEEKEDDELVRFDEDEDEEDKDFFTELASKLDAIYERQLVLNGDVMEPLNNIDHSNEAIFNAVNEIAQWKKQANDDTTAYYAEEDEEEGKNDNDDDDEDNDDSKDRKVTLTKLAGDVEQIVINTQDIPKIADFLDKIKKDTSSIAAKVSDMDDSDDSDGGGGGGGGGTSPSPGGGGNGGGRGGSGASKMGGKFLKGLGSLAVGALSFVGNFAKKMFGQATEDWRIFNQQAAETGRRMGTSLNNVHGMTLQLIKDTMKLGATYGMTRDELIQIQDEIIATTGRQTILTEKETERMAAVTRVLGHDVTEASVEAFDKLGGSVSTAGSAVEGMFKRASALGLDAQKTTREFVRNMNLAKSVTFKSGVDGISKMTALSQRLKFNMESVASAAQGNFSTIEDSIKNAAQLQMLGGSFAANFANPLAAMADATMDMEGFTDRIVDTFKGKGTFNKETGIVEISPVDKALMREAAKAIGMTYDELATMASQQAKEAEILNALGKDNFTKAEQALIASKAQFDQERGAWTVSYFDANGRVTKTLEELKENPELLKAIEDGNDPNMVMQKDVHGFHMDFLKYAERDAQSLNETEGGVDATVRAGFTRAIHGVMAGYDKTLKDQKGNIVDAVTSMSNAIGSRLDWIQKYPMAALMVYLGAKGLQQFLKVRNLFKGPSSGGPSAASRAAKGVGNFAKKTGKALWQSVRHPIQSIKNGGFLGNMGVGNTLKGKLFKFAGGGGLGGALGGIIGDQLFGEGKLLDFGEIGNKIGKIATEATGGLVAGGPWGAAGALLAGTIREFGKDWGNALSETGENLKQSDNGFIRGVGHTLDALGGFFVGASEFLDEPIKTMKDKWAQGIMDWGDSMAKNNDGIVGALGKCIKVLGGVMKEFMSFLEHPIDYTKSIAKRGWNYVKGLFSLGGDEATKTTPMSTPTEPVNVEGVGVQHFDKGGIVGGTSFTGDKVSIKANSGDQHWPNGPIRPVITDQHQCQHYRKRQP